MTARVHLQEEDIKERTKHPWLVQAAIFFKEYPWPADQNEEEIFLLFLSPVFPFFSFELSAVNVRLCCVLPAAPCPACHKKEALLPSTGRGSKAGRFFFAFLLFLRVTFFVPNSGRWEIFCRSFRELTEREKGKIYQHWRISKSRQIAFTFTLHKTL